MNYSFSSPSGKALEAALRDWAQPRNLVTSFGDALEMLVCECTPHWVDPETRQFKGRYTAEYLEVVKRYDPDHVRKYYPPVCKALFAAYQEYVTPNGGWCDPLGSYFEQISSTLDKQHKGIFFTPKPVCDFMAQALAGDALDKREQTVLDPACGSGRILLAFDRACLPGSNHFYRV